MVLTSIVPYIHKIIIIPYIPKVPISFFVKCVLKGTSRGTLGIWGIREFGEFGELGKKTITLSFKLWVITHTRGIMKPGE